MIPKYILTLHESAEPIRGLVTKFGGQPTWLGEPQWPLSCATGEPMQFICQIALDPQIFGEMPGRMAYVFMTDILNDYVDCTWEPDGGENAVIIQSGGACEVPTETLTTGPTLPSEYTVTTVLAEDPDTIMESKAVSEEGYEEAHAAFHALLSETKIGGAPAFLQYPETPSGGPWRFLLQLDSAGVPFEINFGDAGIGYAFLSEDGTRGKFLWQCL